MERITPELGPSPALTRLTPCVRRLCCTWGRSRWLAHSHRSPPCSFPVCCVLRPCRSHTASNIQARRAQQIRSTNKIHWNPNTKR